LFLLLAGTTSAVFADGPNPPPPCNPLGQNCPAPYVTLSGN
jgi:hypothetical protein